MSQERPSKRIKTSGDVLQKQQPRENANERDERAHWVEPFPSPPNSICDLPTPGPCGQEQDEQANQEDDSADRYEELQLIDPYAQEQRSSSPSSHSITSLTPSAFASSFQFLPEYGRTYSTRSTTYKLPADNEEIERLNLQHSLVKLCQRGNYRGPVQEILVYDEDHSKAILDLGCGTGLWAREIATEFPYCDVVGIDLVPIQPRPLPPNFRVELDDVNLPMDHFYGSFDLIHAQFICQGIQDYHNLIAEISRMLRPGGLILLVEVAHQLFDEHHQSINAFEPDPNRRHYSSSLAAGQSVLWSALFMGYLQQAVRSAGGSPDVTESMEKWLKEEQFEFEEVTVEDRWIPIGKWYLRPETSEQNYSNLIGELCRRNWSSLVVASNGLLIPSGLPETFVKSLQKSTLEEAELMGSGRGPRVCIRLRSVWAKKKR